MNTPAPVKTPAPKARAPAPTFSNALQSSKLGIVSGLEDVNLTEEDMNNVSLALLAEMKNNDGSKTVINFEGIKKQCGWLQVNCKNLETKD